MAVLLAAELEGQGFEGEGDVLLRKQHGVTIEVGASTGTVKVSAQMQEEVDLKQDATGWGDEDYGARGRRNTEKRLREEAKRGLDRQASQKEEKLTQQATEQLEGVLRDLQGELDGVVNRVTAQALKQKAAQSVTSPFAFSTTMTKVMKPECWSQSKTELVSGSKVSAPAPSA